MTTATEVSQILTDHFEDIKQHIREDCGLTDISYHTWIEPLTFLTFKDGTVFILIPTDNHIQLSYLENHYMDFFKVAISEHLQENTGVSFVLQKDAPALTGVAAFPDFSAEDFSAQEKDKEEHADFIGLNDKYRFDTFVVGGNNNFAYSAALAVAESPGVTYNPLFLYGGPGLGKTHLMHSIGHYIGLNTPHSKILYVTSEQFTNEVIESIRSGQKDSKVMTRFREKYRTVDVLLLDDVQFIIGKESTQEEFFHTFNALKEAGKQIVLSSDKPPRQMETLEERFQSRFESGLIADIQAPDYETKMAIMKKLGEQYPVEIDDSAYSYIANNIKSNIRQLEGAFNKIIAHSRINNVPRITEEVASQALKDFLHPDIDRVITYQRVIDTVCEHFSVPQDDLLGQKRSAEIVFPRMIAMYLCRRYVPNNSYKEIGQSLGGKDHTTVMNGENKVHTQLKTDAELARTLDILVKKLNPAL